MNSLDDNGATKPPAEAQAATPLAVEWNGGLGIGTRIRFIKTITTPATGDHPALLYAMKDEGGTIIGHDCIEGFQVRADNWHQWFGANRDEFEVTPNV